MSAGEPDWLTAMRCDLAPTAYGWWFTSGDQLIQLLDNARRLLADRDSAVAAAERMAAGLEAICADNLAHAHSRAQAPARYCNFCGQDWPCPTAQAADALRAWQEREAD